MSDKWIVLFIVCFVAIEIVICTIIVLTSPDGNLLDVTYSEMKNEAFVQCEFNAGYSHYHTALWWSYNTGMVLVCTYQAYLTRKVPGNYNEARFIAFNMITISTDVLVFFLSYYGTNGFYKDVLVSSFLAVADTVTLCCLFLPKVYIIVLRPEKNVAHHIITRMGTIESEEGQKARNSSAKSNVFYLSSSSSNSNNSELNSTKPEGQVEREQKMREVPLSDSHGSTLSHEGCVSGETGSNEDTASSVEAFQCFQKVQDSREDSRKIRFHDKGNERLSVVYEGVSPDVEQSNQ